MSLHAVGKSDLYEALVQIIILTILQDEGPMKIKAIGEELALRASMVSDSPHSACQLAITKLEISGWVKSVNIRLDDGRVAYKLTATARRMLPSEQRVWKHFLQQLPEIAHTLNQILR